MENVQQNYAATTAQMFVCPFVANKSAKQEQAGQQRKLKIETFPSLAATDLHHL
jgi:hypothetical protein